ncbi:MAG TPA: hypothetical protein VK050_09245 [Flavobacteriaceae bacterium]|nr:hypothetical protein [Flavobacteriaceae bacterium]
MKNKFTIRAISVAVYFLAVVLWFFIIKDKISTNYRHLVVVAGLIGAVYFIPSSLIKSLREDLPIKRYLIASDIIFYLAFAYMVLIALADNPLFEIVGIVVMFINLLFCIVSYFKTEKNEKMIQRLITVHILLAFFMPIISY